MFFPITLLATMKVTSFTIEIFGIFLAFFVIHCNSILELHKKMPKLFCKYIFFFCHNKYSFVKMKIRALCSKSDFSLFFQNVNPKIKKQHKKTLCNFQKSKMKFEKWKKVKILHVSKENHFFYSLITPFICSELPTWTLKAFQCMGCFGRPCRQFYLHEKHIKRSPKFPKCKNRVVRLAKSCDNFL